MTVAAGTYIPAGRRVMLDLVTFSEVATPLKTKEKVALGGWWMPKFLRGGCKTLTFLLMAETLTLAVRNEKSTSSLFPKVLYYGRFGTCTSEVL